MATISELFAEARDVVDANSTSLPDATLLRNFNRASGEINGRMLAYNKNFRIDDRNHSDRPVGYGNLQNGVQHYAYDISMSTIERIEVVDINQAQESVFEQEYTNVDLNIDYSLAYFCISYNIIIDADSSCLATVCDPISPQPICFPATVTLNGGSFLEVESGETANILLVDQGGNPVIPESVIDNIIVVDVTCEQATAIIKNSQGTVILTEEIPSGGTEVIILPDEQYEVEVDGEVVSSGSVPVYGDEDIIIDL